MTKPQKGQKQLRHTNDRLRDNALEPLIGYMRVSKADGSQVLDLQRDALLAAGVQTGLHYPVPNHRQPGRPTRGLL